MGLECYVDMNEKSWQEINNSLEKTFEFNSFQEAIHFMQAASESIDEINHHPEWTNVYKKVFVKLRTHDAGNIVTKLDYMLAELLDKFYENR